MGTETGTTGRDTHNPPEPPNRCALCPRLASFRDENRSNFGDYWNAPVPSFGDIGAPLLIVGLAPGLHGANRTGRPFTGDAAGDHLYRALLEVGLADGEYAGHAGDGIRLLGTRTTNAVRCVPPGNKPTGAEVRTCRKNFLEREIKCMHRLRVVVALGRVAHEAVVAAAGLRQRDAPFSHGARHDSGRSWQISDSYHCSRYNINTGRITPSMLVTVLDRARFRAETGRWPDDA